MEQVNADVESHPGRADLELAPASGRDGTRDTLHSHSGGSDSPERLVGSILNQQYRLDAHIGSGGFGDVFRAVQEATGQSVALKILRVRKEPGAPSVDRQVARFMREMSVCAGLHHPHIVRIIDSGRTATGAVFSVFEYVPGRTLSELLEDAGALTVQTTIDLMTQVLDALTCAHGSGVVHRDLKPSNIMISTTGARSHATVLDFGVSAFLDGVPLGAPASLTLTQEVLGTPSYAAPEQLRGEPPSPKSDLYAWGLIFLECVLGRRVLSGASAAEVTYRQLSVDEIPIPSVLDGHWLGVLLRWVLRKDLMRRVGRAELVLDRLLERRGTDELIDAHGYLALDREQRRSPTSSDIRELDGRSLESTAAERRQLTILSCSCRVPSPARAPEGIDHAIRDFHSVCIDIGTRFGGYSNGVLGGHVTLCFGYPRATDTDARRASIAAMEIVKAATRASEHAIQVRVGLHTGFIVTDDSARGAARFSGATSAEAMYLASRAPIGTILASAQARDQLQRDFAFSPIGLDGETHYRLLSEESTARVAKANSAGLTAFVGRGAELSILSTAMEAAQRGLSRTLLIIGEPGIGKSRLLGELHAATKQSDWLEIHCVPEASQSALRPILELIQRECKLKGASTDEGASRLQAELQNLGVEPDEAMAVLCPWLGVEPKEGCSPLPYAPIKRKALLIRTLVELILAMAKRQGAVLVIEDLHWADPTTSEWLGQIIDRIPQSGTLLVLTARPEFLATWSDDRVQRMTLNSLDRASVEQMVDALTPSRSLTASLRQQVIERADGIPMFVEEILRLLQDSPGDSPAPHDSPGFEVPRTLRDLLTGRLDRLESAKETAQLAAAIGREFDLPLLQNASGRGESDVLADIEAMLSAGLLTRWILHGESSYVFRHALIRDAAYEGLPAATRRQMHHRIADVLEGMFPDTAVERPELLADHWSSAHRMDKAIPYARRAAEISLMNCLYREACAHSRKALNWTALIPLDARRDELELELINLYAPALMASTGWGSDEVRAQLERAESLSRSVSSAAAGQYAMLWLLLMYHSIRANFDRFSEVQRRALEIAAQTQDSVLESVVYGIVGQNLFVQGRLGEAREACERALELYDVETHRTHRQRFGQDVFVFAQGTLGMLSALQGDIDQAIHCATGALAHAEALKSTYNICMAKAYLAGTWHYCGDRKRTAETARSLAQEADTHGLIDWLPIANILGGWANNLMDEPERESDRIWALGNRYAGPYWSFTIAQTEYSLGRFEAALTRIAGALAQSAELGVLYYVPELQRLRADCQAAQAQGGSASGDARTAVRAAYEEAIQSARAQGGRLPELRAALGLARCSHPSVPEAVHQQLLNVVETFRTGLDLPELQEARHLLRSCV
jgi:TOMM system kinase/cyclase fusion protein